MTDTPPPVDAGGQAPASDNTPATQDAAYWKNEMHNAVKARQDIKEKFKGASDRISELETQLADSQKPVDADDDIAAKLSAVTAERDGLSAKLENQAKQYREESILSKLTAGLPDDRHAAIASLYRSNAASLDDGKAEIADIVKEAGELLSKIAAPLFQTQSSPTEGRLPHNGAAAEFDPEAARAKTRAAIRKSGGTGVTL